MAVKNVTQTMGDNATVDEKGIVAHERYLVTADSTDTPLIAYGASHGGMTVPVYYDLFDIAYPLLRAASIQISRWQDDKSPVFLVEVEFRIVSTEKKPDGGGKWNKKVSSSGVEVVEMLNIDANGNAVRNSNGDIVQDWELVLYDAIISVSFNTDSSSSFIAMENARGLINDSPVTLTITRFGMTYTRTFPAKTLKLGNATWDVDITPDGEGSFNVSIPLIYRHQLNKDGSEIGWAVQTPDRGYRYLAPRDDGKFALTDFLPAIVDLDHGKKLAIGAKQIMIVIDAIKTADFSAFLSGV